MTESAPITWFTENPTPILVGGGLALLVLLAFLLKSGRGIIMLAMAGVALIMLLAVLIDRLVVTEREQVANVIYAAAADAERNDFEAAMQFVSPSAAEVRAEAKRWMRVTKLTTVNVSAMEAKVDHSTDPPTATAEFRLFAQGRVVDQGTAYEGPYIRRLIVHLHREGNRWLITSYEFAQ